MKNLLFSWAGLMLVLFTLTVGPDATRKSFPVIHAERSFTLSSKLYPLFIEATDFYNILVDLDGIAGKKKLIFQFFFKRNGDLTLALYRGKLNHHDFDSLHDIKLDVQSNCVIENIDGMGVYLGDLEINNQDGNLDSLKRAANSGVKFIVFVPVLDTVGVHPRKNIILYNICKANTKAEMCQLPLQASSTGIIANPSPPRNGN